MKYSIALKATILALAAVFLITPVASATPTAAENTIYKLVNEKRRQAGMRPLKFYRKLEMSARRHSYDMVQNSFFSHYSPYKGTLTNRLNRIGVRGWNSAGENLAGAYSSEVVFQLWLDSWAHRRNMLKPSYTHMGVGIIAGGPYGLMVTMDLAENPL